MAIQLIINREWGLAKNENPNQGSFIIEELTDLVEEAVLQGVRGASPSAAACSARWRPATSAARSRKSRCYYEHAQARRLATRSSASTPSAIRTATPAPQTLELARSTDDEKQSQLDAPRATSTRATRTRRRPRSSALQQAVIDNGNVFEVLMDAVRVCSLGQITHALFEVGGQYRRSM